MRGLGYRVEAERCSSAEAPHPLAHRCDSGAIPSGASAIASTSTGAAIVITVDDDGPGLDASMREAVLQRGVRVDEAAPGSGLGLAIVRDLVELYGGSIALTNSRPGGLRARLQLPS